MQVRNNSSTRDISRHINGTKYHWLPSATLTISDLVEVDTKRVLLDEPDLEVVYDSTADAAVAEAVSVVQTGSPTPYAGASSKQHVGPDLNVAVAVGSNTPTAPKFIAAIMGNILGASLTRVANYLAGVIGAYSLTGVKASRYPAGGVVGIISDGVTEADGAVVAHLDGDSAVTGANSAFKAMARNSNPGSGFDYGMDLHDPAVDGYNALAIRKASLRFPSEVCMLQGAGAPTGSTGVGFANKGSMYIDITTPDLYLNAGSKAVPSWKLFTRAA